MKQSKYQDVVAAMQVIGGVYMNPALLDDERYKFTQEDFTEEFHVILFGSILNLHLLGAKQIDINTIEHYLQERTTKFATYTANHGREYLTKLEQIVQLPAFDYYYHRVKKFTLLRMYSTVLSMDLRWLYDPDVMDVKKRQKQEDWLDRADEQYIVDIISSRIDTIRNKYLYNTDYSFRHAGEGLRALITELQEHPDIGYPLYGKFINTVYWGARLSKFYLRSAATNVGKTRAMVADFCVIGCSEYYDKKKGEWISCGDPEPTGYFGTEQEIKEMQTAMLAFVADVNESHITHNMYQPGEFERVMRAVEIIEKSQIQLKTMLDFSLEDIENTIKSCIQQNKTRYFFFDYIHSSLKILSEIGSKAKVSNLREDTILFMMSVKFKEICLKYDVFLMSSTQLSNDYHTASIFDQGLLQGAKAIANKIDCGEIMLEVTQKDLEALKDLIKQNGFDTPTIKKVVYKNRGEYKNIFIWCTADLGTCRINPIFVTDYSYKLLDIPNLIIDIKEKSFKEASAF